MYIVHVDIHVKADFLDAFREATLENARSSIQEQGIARFDFIQRSDDPTRFLLVEVYHTPEDADLHKLTGHYQKWRDTVAEMMAEPRVGTKYTAIFPGDDGWD
ncbi:MAG: antibiotic biosynthesis monooxygenase [Anaerolineae bacterium]|nr:antibiotic biosynthesis monooxygenase [Anaerolineae bacterium]